MKTLLSCLLLCAFIQLNAQESSSLRLHLQGYNLVFPGLEVAWEYPIFAKKFTNKKEKTSTLQAIIAPVAEVYFYRGNHTGIAINGDLSLKYQLNNGLEFQAYGGIGLLNAILAGEVYELGDNGEFTSSKLKGNRYVQWKTGFGFGKHLTTKNGKPISINLRAGIREARLPAGPIIPSITIGVNYFLNKKEE